MIKVLFFGNPEISVGALNALFDHQDIDVIGVVTNKDKAIGRSHSNFKATAVKEFALSNNINIYESNSINNDIAIIDELEFDYLITCAFGQFLSDDILSLPKKKAINIHASLLPRGRGGAPIH
jgi:methionyl-tRNA formyltransferase